MTTVSEEGPFCVRCQWHTKMYGSEFLLRVTCNAPQNRTGTYNPVTGDELVRYPVTLLRGLPDKDLCGPEGSWHVANSLPVRSPTALVQPLTKPVVNLSGLSKLQKAQDNL